MTDTDFTISLPDKIINRISREVAKEVSSAMVDWLTLNQPAIQKPYDEGMNNVVFLRLKEICKRTGLSRATIYRKMSEGTFPASIKLGPRTVAWRIEVVEYWESNPR